MSTQSSRTLKYIQEPESEIVSVLYWKGVRMKLFGPNVLDKNWIRPMSWTHSGNSCRQWSDPWGTFVPCNIFDAGKEESPWSKGTRSIRVNWNRKIGNPFFWRLLFILTSQKSAFLFFNSYSVLENTKARLQRIFNPTWSLSFLSLILKMNINSVYE